MDRRKAIEQLMVALDQQHVGDPPMLSTNVKIALGEVDWLFDGAICRWALSRINDEWEPPPRWPYDEEDDDVQHR